MNWKKYGSYLLAFSFGFFSCFLGTICFQKESTAPSLLQVVSSEGIQSEKKIQESTELYKIRAYFPYTSYLLLDKEISNFIQKTIQEFKSDILKNQVLLFQPYTLDIRYDTYHYKQFISYVFYTFVDTGGAHPNTTIHTITFNQESNKIVDIQSLIEKNSNILEILSKESFAQLKNSEKFQNDEFSNIQDMMIEGTKATPENFRNFAFSENGLIVFFENYQVAPYVYGSFQVPIPYSNLGLGI